MTSLFKNKKDKEKDVKNLKQESPEEKAAKELEERVNKEVAIHSMPQKFRSEKARASQSKTVGVLIVVGGIVLMGAVVAGLYYFLFMAPQEPATPRVETEEPTATTEEEEEMPAEEEAGPATTAPEDEEEEAEQATTTPDEETATTTPEEEAEEEEDEPIETQGMQDSDNDGLTDEEEEILGTSKNSQDSDGDGYDDLTELTNLYNPAGSGKLEENSDMTGPDDEDVIYDVIYPSAWFKSEISDEGSIILNSPDNHFLQIVVQENNELESIDEWYEKMFGEDSIIPENRISTDTWDGVRSDEGLEIYLVDKDRRYIIVLSYTPLDDDELIYKNIFDLAVNSFVIR